MQFLCNFDPIEIRNSHQTLNVNVNAQVMIIVLIEKQRLLFKLRELRVAL